MEEGKQVYEEFLSAVPMDSLLGTGLSLFATFMTKITEKDPEGAPMIGRTIDAQIGSVVIQHLEAALRSPDSVPDVIRLLRDEVNKKINSLADGS